MTKSHFGLGLALSLLLPSAASPQSPPETLAKRLGYPADAKLLIVHADDLGVTHSVDSATINAMDTGLVNSASIMVPCAWFPEMVAYAKAHPAADLGLHLTLTSERTSYRWGPVASREKVPTLVDEAGYFHQDWTDAKRINPQEAELELRAQIAKAYALGLHPTHLDSHQLRLYENGKDLFDVLLRVGHEYKLPVLVSRDWFLESPYLRSSLGPDDLVIDHTVTMTPDVLAEQWSAFYTERIKKLSPGVTELIIHLAFDNEEMRAFSSDRPTWGAAWRQRDYDFFTSETFRGLLQENHITLITWREIGTRINR